MEIWGGSSCPPMIDKRRKRSRKSVRLSNATVITKICWIFINIWKITKSKYNFHSSNTRMTKPRVPCWKRSSTTSSCIYNILNNNNFIWWNKLKIRVTSDCIYKRTLYNSFNRIANRWRELALGHKSKKLRELIEAITPHKSFK